MHSLWVESEPWTRVTCVLYCVDRVPALVCLPCLGANCGLLAVCVLSHSPTSQARGEPAMFPFTLIARSSLSFSRNTVFCLPGQTCFGTDSLSLFPSLILSPACLPLFTPDLLLCNFDLRETQLPFYSPSEERFAPQSGLSLLRHPLETAEQDQVTT